MKQRRRWGAGQANWLTRRWRMLLGSIADHPKTLIAALLIIFPSLPLFAATFAFPDTLYVNAVSLALLVFAGKLPFFIPPIVAMLMGVATMKFFAALLVVFSGFAIVYYYFAKRLGYGFNVLEFAFFFVVYNPLWLTISLATLIRVLIWRNGFKLDWKI